MILPHSFLLVDPVQCRVDSPVVRRQGQETELGDLDPVVLRVRQEIQPVRNRVDRLPLYLERPESLVEVGVALGASVDWGCLSTWRVLH